jgi:hypothetical protein
MLTESENQAIEKPALTIAPATEKAAVVVMSPADKPATKKAVSSPAKPKASAPKSVAAQAKLATPKVAASKVVTPKVAAPAKMTEVNVKAAVKAIAAAKPAKADKINAKAAPKPAAKPAAKPATKAATKVATKPVVKVATKPTAKPATKVATKPVTKALVKSAVKPAAKPATAAKAVQGTMHKAKKEKLIRDSFTMPESEYAVLGQVKKACISAGVEVKKSQLLRIGLLLLSQTDVTRLANLIASLAPLKAGRPKKEK